MDYSFWGNMCNSTEAMSVQGLEKYHGGYKRRMAEDHHREIQDVPEVKQVSNIRTQTSSQHSSPSIPMAVSKKRPLVKCAYRSQCGSWTQYSPPSLPHEKVLGLTCVLVPLSGWRGFLRGKRC